MVLQLHAYRSRTTIWFALVVCCFAVEAAADFLAMTVWLELLCSSCNCLPMHGAPLCGHWVRCLEADDGIIDPYSYDLGGDGCSEPLTSPAIDTHSGAGV
jgi:hypothetical protein